MSTLTGLANSTNPTRTLSAIQSLITTASRSAINPFRATGTAAGAQTSISTSSYTFTRHVPDADEYQAIKDKEDRDVKIIVASIIIGVFLMIGLSCWCCFHFSPRGKRKRARRRAERERRRLGLAPINPSDVRGPYMVDRGSSASLPRSSASDTSAAIRALGRPDPNACMRCLDRFVSAPVGAPGSSGRPFGCTCSGPGAASGGRYFNAGEGGRRPIILRENSDDTVRDMDLDSEAESDLEYDLERGMGIVRHNGIWGRPVDIDNPGSYESQTTIAGDGGGTRSNTTRPDFVDELEAAYRAEIVAAQAELDALGSSTSAAGPGRGLASLTRSPRDVELQTQITALRTRIADRRAQVDRQERRRRRALARARAQAAGGESTMDWGPLNHLARSSSNPSSAAPARQRNSSRRDSNTQTQTIYTNPRDPEGGIEDAAPAYVQEARDREVVIDAAEPEGPPEYRVKEEEGEGARGHGSAR